MACAVVSTVHADDRDTSSIVDFVKARNRWNRLVGQPLSLEGRYTAWGKTLRFKNCDLEFVLSDTFTRPKTNNIQVAGRLVRRNGKLEFHVSDLKQRESDLDQLKLKRSLIDSSNPQEVFDVADWARERGTFYSDEELLKEADRLYREGLKIAADHLEPTDADGLRKLAKQSQEFGVDEKITQDLLHRAIRLEWQAAQKSETPNEEYPHILAMIRRDLPGASTPLSKSGLAFRRDYEKAPLVAYRLADPATRRRLARAFYLEVGLANILLSADESGRNGDQIATRIERDLPELTSLAAEYRSRELQYLSSRVGKLTRQQVMDLSDRFADQGDRKQSATVIRSWLALQESRAAAAGPNSLMELGDEYVNLLRDERAAARMYQLAYAKNPQLTAARDWLTAHGYELKGKEWTRPGEAVDDAQAAAISDAIAEGRIQMGMTGKQVLKALGTTPSSSMQIASAGTFSELWVFKDYGISVRLQRSTAGGNAEVVQIDTVD